MKKAAFTFLSCALFLGLKAQVELTVQQYIDKYKDISISEMRRSGVPASITLAQGILESENGNGELCRKSNNHFGIKCKSSWTGNAVYHNDDEMGECFRKYDSDLESFRDHSDFLKNSARYASLFSLDPRDYKAWSYGLKRAGYATNPRYPEVLIKYIENYDLQQYTLVALGGEQPVEELAFSPGAGYSATEESNGEATGNAAMNEARVEKYRGLKRIHVSNGTSLLALASRLNIPLSRLLDYNDFEQDGLLGKNQWIYLEKKLSSGEEPTFTAAEEATLWDVSQATAIQLKYLLEYNPGLTRYEVVSGQSIRLQPLPAVETKQNTTAIIHEVKHREGLYGIAKKYDVSVNDIRKWNNLSGNRIRPGQQLIISKQQN